mgnify:FL=1
MSSSTYFNNGKLFSKTYHIADLDKASMNRFQRARDDNNDGSHNMTGKSTGHNNVVPIYSNDAVVNPELAKIPRFADDRHRVLEDRRQKQFHRSHSELITRPY